MTNTGHTTRRLPAAARALGAAALAALLGAAAPDGWAQAQQDDAQEEAADQIEREEPLARVGLTEEFSAVLDSAPETVDWERFRNAVAVRWEPGKNEDLEAGSRRHLVLHATVVEDGEISEHHTSDVVELLPGGTKLDPEGGFLPDESMVPDGYRITDLMALGEIEVEPGEIMTELVEGIIADMTEDAPALYLAATPPEDDADGPQKIHPVLVRLAPAEG
ncbi:MAG: hypothetical protein ACOC83_08745 [Gemmatimonadota bacterium]